MAKQRVSGLAAIHPNLPILFPPPPPPPGGYTAAEQPALAQLGKYAGDGSGYASIQATCPQTLGYGLADSPVGQAMWIYEKFQRNRREACPSVSSLLPRPPPAVSPLHPSLRSHPHTHL